MDQALIDLVLAPFVKITLLIFAFVMPFVTYLILWERKLLAYMQARLGPNRVGPKGLLQPIADAIKLACKEDITPTRAEKVAFFLAPCLVIVPAFVVFSVIPFGGESEFFLPKVLGLIFGGVAPEVARWSVTDVNVGLLFVVAVSSIGVYGIILGGWASNNKYSLMGGLRSAAQMISYEVPQGLAIVGPLMLAGTMSLVGIVEAQRTAGWWYLFPQLVSFFIYMVAGVAETNRNPFDLPEAESELVAGFHTEYSGMRFALFFLGEYANMIVISAVATTLFLGGWLPPFANWLPALAAVPGPVWFILKMSVFLFAYIWFRGTFPRYRFDQLMDLGWKWMIPLALANISLIGLVKLQVWKYLF